MLEDGLTGFTNNNEFYQSDIYRDDVVMRILAVQSGRFSEKILNKLDYIAKHPIMSGYINTISNLSMNVFG